MSTKDDAEIKKMEKSLRDCDGDIPQTGFNGLQSIARSLVYSPINKLKNNEKDIKIGDATLDQFSRLFERFDKRDFRISKFFEDHRHESLYAFLTPYKNGILQYVLNDFLESKGYQILHTMCSAYADEEETKIAEIKCDIDKTFNAYLDATILCYNPKNDGRICIEITVDQHRGGLSYLIFFNEVAKDFWSEWQEYAKNNNFYKGKKINAMCDFLE